MTTELSICSIVADIKDNALTSDKKAKLIDLLMENQQKNNMIMHLAKITRYDLIVSMLKRYLEQLEENDLSNIMRFLEWWVDKANKSYKAENKDKEDEEIGFMVADNMGVPVFQLLKLFQNDKNLLKIFNKLPQDNMTLLLVYIKGCMMEHKKTFEDIE